MSPSRLLALMRKKNGSRHDAKAPSTRLGDYRRAHLETHRSDVEAAVRVARVFTPLLAAWRLCAGTILGLLSAGLPRLALLLAFAAGCVGGDDGTAPPPDGPAPINTLAYVDTACRDGAGGFFSATQELRVRRGDSAPVTVARIPMIGPLRVPLTYCGLFGSFRNGSTGMGNPEKTFWKRR